MVKCLRFYSQCNFCFVLHSLLNTVLKCATKTFCSRQMMTALVDN